MSSLVIYQAVHCVFCLFNVPKINSLLVSSDKIFGIVRHANRMKPVFFARLVSGQVLSLFWCTDFFWFRNHKTFAFIKHFCSRHLLINALFFQSKEFDITSGASKNERYVSFSRINPLNLLDTFWNVLRIKNIKTFSMCLKFCKIIEICLSKLVLDSLENDNTTTSISHGKDVACLVKAYSR